MRRPVRKRRAGCNCASLRDASAAVRDPVRNLAHDRLRDLTAFYRRCSRYARCMRSRTYIVSGAAIALAIAYGR
ncbi:MAG: hypothetical protein ACXVAN_17155, partial [Polyangia bacterium]